MNSATEKLSNDNSSLGTAQEEVGKASQVADANQPAINQALKDFKKAHTGFKQVEHKKLFFAKDGGEALVKLRRLKPELTSNRKIESYLEGKKIKVSHDTVGRYLTVAEKWPEIVKEAGPKIDSIGYMPALRLVAAPKKRLQLINPLPPIKQPGAEIYHGDCLYELPLHVKSASVDLIMTSPCYAEQRSVGISVAEYERWFVDRADQFKRVLKPRGSMIINIKEHCEQRGPHKGQRSRYVLDLLYLLMEHGWEWIDTFCWVKTSTYPGDFPNKLKCGWEPLYHFAKQTDIAFYHEQVMQHASEQTIRRAKKQKDKEFRRREAAMASSPVVNEQQSSPRQRNESYQESATGSGLSRDIESYYSTDGLVRPDNVIVCAPEGRNLGHDSPFPENLPAFFIDLLTQRGDTVLDPFSGSGTTAKVAKDKERNFIAIDMNPKNIPLIQNRTSQGVDEDHDDSEE